MAMNVCVCVFVSENAPRCRIHDIFDHYIFTCTVHCLCYAYVVQFGLNNTAKCKPIF